LSKKRKKRATNNYLHIKGQSVQKIHFGMKEVLEKDATAQAAVYRWTDSCFTEWSAAFH